MLFYLGFLLSLVLMVQDPMLVWMSWAFVGFRFLHSLIHCTYNDVNHRFTAYLLSCLVLLFLWLRIAMFIIMN